MGARIVMLKSLAPEEIPNGSIGYTEEDIEQPGLIRAVFGEFVAYVYLHEVEISGNR